MKSREIDSSIDRITREAVNASSASVIPAGSVLVVVRSGILARTIPTAVTLCDLAVNQDIKVLCPSRRLDAHYLEYFLRAYEPDLLKLVTRGATVHRLTTDVLKSMGIPLPSLSEQVRTVATLDEAFAALATATGNTEKNLVNARELFDSSLEAAFVSTKDVAKTPLAELCHADRVITYGVIKLGKEQPDGVPCLRTSNVRRLRIDTEGIKRIDPALSAEFKRTILRGGEVLVNVRGTLGGVAVVPDSMSGWNVSREVAVVPANHDLIDSEFLAYCIATRTNQAWLTGVLKGVAYTGINIGDLRNLPIAVPPRERQLELVERLKQGKVLTHALQSRCQHKLALLIELKQSILHKAFTGELTADFRADDVVLSKGEV